MWSFMAIENSNEMRTIHFISEKWVLRFLLLYLDSSDDYLPRITQIIVISIELNYKLKGKY